MKKTILTLALFLGSLLASHAQYSTDPSNNLKISNVTAPVASHVKVLPNGDAYVAYLSYEKYGTLKSSAFLKLQMLDKAGNIASGWPVGGIYVSEHYTATYDTDYGMEITPDGSVILVHSDSRNNLDTNNPIFQPFAYKINKNAQFVWDRNGIAMVSDPTRTSCQKPKVFLNNSGSPIISWSDGTDEPSAAVFTRLNAETGEKIFEPVSIPGAIQPLVVPSDGDNIIVVYLTNPNPGYVYAVKYDRQGNQITTGAWAEPVKLGIYAVMTMNSISGAESDGEGGAIVCWHGMDGDGHYSMIQRITKDGALTMGDAATRASGTFYYCTTPQLAVDKTNKEAYVLFIRHYVAGAIDAYVAKLDYNGQFVFPDSLKMVVGYQYNRIADGLTVTGDGVIGVLQYKTESPANPIMTAFAMSRDGNIRWGGDTTIVSSVVSAKAYVDISEYAENQVVAVWAGGREIYVQNIISDQDSVGIKPIEINAAASFKTYPNPATDRVNIQIDLTSRQNVTIEILDIQGKKITTLVNNQSLEGTQTYEWKAAGAAKGIYFVSVRVGQARKTSKVVIQ